LDQLLAQAPAVLKKSASNTRRQTLPSTRQAFRFPNHPAGRPGTVTLRRDGALRQRNIATRPFIVPPLYCQSPLLPQILSELTL
ncbi:MAG: hypothetical protein ACREE6_17610, partial [Limisphaerales bacterium]